MIEYREFFRFTNDVGEFFIDAHTQEHPSGYGNGTLLRFDVISNPRGYGRDRLFDIRYEPVADKFDVRRLVHHILKSDYGVEL